MSEPESMIKEERTPSLTPPTCAETVVAFAPRKEQPGGQAKYFFMKIVLPGFKSS